MIITVTTRDISYNNDNTMRKEDPQYRTLWSLN